MGEGLATLLFITTAWLITFGIMTPSLIRDLNKYPKGSEERARWMDYESPIYFAYSYACVVLLLSFFTMLPLLGAVALAMLIFGVE